MFRFLLLSLLIVTGAFFLPRIADLSPVWNLSFEEKTADGAVFHWLTGGRWNSKLHRRMTPEEYGCLIGLDSTVVHGGKYSMVLKSLSGGDWGSARSHREEFSDTFKTILRQLRGKVVTYSGWIKTQNVSKWAGLWWRVDGADEVLEFNNMYDSLVCGTRDWHKYSFTIPVGVAATSFDFGVIMGSEKDGTAWFDDLTIDTNGVPFMH